MPRPTPVPDASSTGVSLQGFALRSQPRLPARVRGHRGPAATWLSHLQGTALHLLP